MRLAIPRPSAWHKLPLALAALLLAPEIATAQQRKMHSGLAKVGEQSIPYQLILPQGFDAAAESDQKHPLVLFLHGSGERGDDNQKQLGHFPGRLSKDLAEVSAHAFVLAPQCPNGESWNSFASGSFATDFAAPPSVAARGALVAVQDALNKYPIDPERISLTGLSMGGFGAWEMAARKPEMFSAVVPICGGGTPSAAHLYAGIPVQVWHGGADAVVPVQASQAMVRAMKELKLEVDYRELEGVGHLSWVEAYGNADCHALLFESRRDQEKRTQAVAGALAQQIGKGERIAFLGDSITQAGNRPGGYVDLIRRGLDSAGVDSHIIPAGISGHKVPDLLKRFRKDVIDQNASLVFIYIGINDVWHSQNGKGTPKDAFEAGLRELIRELKASGATVVLATPSVIGEAAFGTNSLDTMLAEYAAISKRVALEESVVLCDLGAAFKNWLDTHNVAGATKGILTSDSVHLNSAGNHLVAREAARSLREAVAARPVVRRGSQAKGDGEL